MGILGKFKQTLMQKSVMGNILFCLTVIILMHLLYGVYRSLPVLQEGAVDKGRSAKEQCAFVKTKLKKLNDKINKLNTIRDDFKSHPQVKDYLEDMPRCVASRAPARAGGDAGCVGVCPD